MSQRLSDLVDFRSDRLFEGAVNLDWFSSDARRAEAAARSFVFHGPAYHGVRQQDVGTSHRLLDTASFVRAVVRRCYGRDDTYFTLAIAGYGTGKSHLALTLARLLTDPVGPDAAPILDALRSADESSAREVQAILRESGRPCLVVALNGMQNFDLANEMTSQIKWSLQQRGIDTMFLDELRPRFKQAASVLALASQRVVEEIVAACGVANLEAILAGLDQQDEAIYKAVHQALAARGIPITTFRGESLRDVINETVQRFCGEGKAFQELVVLFDEFGRYTEFAATRSQIAGSGALQHLYEAIQDQSGAARFVGFIQFELNAYLQRIAPEYKNETLRYITRFEQADQVNLSINLETLLASLLEKRDPAELARRFDRPAAQQQSFELMKRLGRWLPQAENHRQWTDVESFHRVIRKGCWPLSPFATWLLYYLAEGGKHLQGRSVLKLLADAFDLHGAMSVPAEDRWALAPVDLWSELLQQQLVNSEDVGQQGSLTIALASVLARHGGRLTEDLRRILIAVVLASKAGLVAADRADALAALAEFAGLPVDVADRAVRLLQDELNVLAWDESFKEFDILGDGVPRTQFLAFLRQQVALSYDEAGKAKLFASKAAEWCGLLGDLECSFAEDKHISTKEWRYQKATATFETLPTHLALAVERWQRATAVDEPRGTVIYCYIEPSRDPKAALSETTAAVRAAAKSAGVSAFPVLIILLCDDEGKLGQALAEYAVLVGALSEADRLRFGNLVPAQKEKLQQAITEHVETMIKRRDFVTIFKEALEARRLAQVGAEIFGRIYSSPIPFPFDGFGTQQGNAAESCLGFTKELLLNRLDFQSLTSKKAKDKNRAVTVLKETWSIFGSDGSVLKYPDYSTIRSIFKGWDAIIGSKEHYIDVSCAIRMLISQPYGANIASAGLLFGVYVASRAERLAIMQRGLQLSIEQWMQGSLFRGKYIDLGALVDVHLIGTGAASSEWEALLDEWRDAKSYLAREDCLKRASELQKRIPIPQAMVYEESRLRDQAIAAIKELRNFGDFKSTIMEKSKHAHEHRNIGDLSRWAASVAERLQKMELELELWSIDDMAWIKNFYGQIRQAVIDQFDLWLSRQYPANDSPDKVGDFKTKMLKLIGSNLKQIGLEEQLQRLDKHTHEAIKKAETLASANQLGRDVKSWISSHTESVRVGKVNELRSLIQAGGEWRTKLQAMARRIDMAEITEQLEQLAKFLQELKQAEEKAKKRLKDLMKAKVANLEDIERLIPEVDALLSAFENINEDLEDIQLMSRALRVFKKGYYQLEDDHLGWSEFERLAGSLVEQADREFGEEELAWSPGEVFANFQVTLGNARKAKSSLWMANILNEFERLEEMTAADARKLRVRANSPPAILTPADTKQLASVQKKIERQLDSLKLEVLIEDYKQLSPVLRKKFMKLAAELVDS